MALDDADSVDADTIRAAQVTHDQRVANLGQTAVSPGNLGGFKLNIALRIPPEKQDRLIQENAGSAVDSLELRRHGFAQLSIAVAGKCRLYASYKRMGLGAIGDWAGSPWSVGRCPWTK